MCSYLLEKNTLPLSLEELFGSRIGLQGTNTYGCVGFLVKSNADSTVPVTGFLTTAHSVIQEYDALYFENCMLSEYKQKTHCKMAKEPQVVQYTDLDFTTLEPVGEVVEAFFGNYGGEGAFGMDAAFVKSFNPNMGGKSVFKVISRTSLTI